MVQAALMCTVNAEQLSDSGYLLDLGSAKQIDGRPKTCLDVQTNFVLDVQTNLLDVQKKFGMSKKNILDV